MTITDIWTTTGVIIGFQMTLFSWRLAEERKVGYAGDIPWLTPSDYMNIVGMLVLVLGVYLLPILDIIDLRLIKVFFGLGIFLFVGQAMGTAAHYQLFNRTKKREFIWFPKQEKVVLALFAAFSFAFIIIGLVRL